jgi:hypothetical protein
MSPIERAFRDLYEHKRAEEKRAQRRAVEASNLLAFRRGCSARGGVELRAWLIAKDALDAARGGFGG